ncbi:hypothetical protein FGRMN_9968 [Fusarium graminum]|nr:hypothetical protein FGRMN_9968 [Fusarium graminum]
MNSTIEHTHAKTTKSAFAGRRRRDRLHCPADLSEPSFFPPRRCTFGRKSHDSSQTHIRPTIHDHGLPLCDVALFQTNAIANSLANKSAISREALQLKAVSRAASSRAQAGSARSNRSRSNRTSVRETYEALTWRNRLRQHPKSSGSKPTPCCTSCFTKETPKWREGPFGSHTLCNVCGLLYAKRESRHRSTLMQRDFDRASEGS